MKETVATLDSPRVSPGQANLRHRRRGLHRNDARAKARYALPRGLFDYVDGGAEGEYTMRRNVEAFEELVWRPRQAIYHEQIDTSTEVLGTKLAMPVMTALVSELVSSSISPAMHWLSP